MAVPSHWLERSAPGSLRKCLLTGPSSTFSQVDRLEDVFSALGIDVGVSGYYGFFSGDAKFDYTKQMKMSQQSSHILAQVTVENSPARCTNPTFTKDAQALLNTGDMVGFRNRFGDGYVRGMQTGGEYFALYSIFNEQLEDQESARASLHARFDAISWGVGGDVSLDMETRNLLNVCEVSILTLQRGGNADGVTPATNPEAIMSRIDAFPKLAQSAPFINTVTVAGYVTLGGIPNPVSVLVRQDTLKHLMSVRLLLQQTRDDVEEELAHPTAFVMVPAVTVLNQWDSDLNDQLNLVNTAAVECAQGGAIIDHTLTLPTKPPYQPPMRPDVVTLFENADFTGKARYIKSKGWYDSDAPAMGWLAGGRLVSIKVPQGLIVRFYSDVHFQAAHLDVTESQPDLGFWKDLVGQLSWMLPLAWYGQPGRNGSPTRTADRVVGAGNGHIRDN